jgi:integrase
MVLSALKRRFAELLLKKKSSDLKRGVYYKYDFGLKPSGLITLISILSSRYLRNYIRSGLIKNTLYLPGIRISELLDVETKIIILRI